MKISTREFLTRKLFRRRLKRPYWPKVIYVEAVYQCNLHCRMCPRDFDATPQVAMSNEVFQRALPALRATPNIDFSGWGETLMAPDAIDFIQSISTRDFHCTLSTNGLLLKGRLAERLLSGKAAYINVSIDGAAAETYRMIRGKDCFDKVIENLKAFTAMRNKLKSRSTIDWIFVMMKSNFRELPRAVEIACEAGVDKFTAKHLELAPTNDFMSEAMWDNPYAPRIPAEISRELSEIIEECRQIANGRICLTIHPLIHTDEFWGQQGPVFKMFLNHAGFVTACSFISPNNHRPFSDPEFNPSWILGNVLETSLEDIIHSRKYLEFQQTWLRGEIPSACQGCPFSFRLDADGLCHAI